MGPASYHDHDRSHLCSRRQRQRGISDSYLTDAQILEFSHQSLLISPDNELYGLGAPLQRCLEPNNISLEGCRRLPEQDLWFSAWHDTERPVYTSRLTYNPWFDDQAEAIGAFIHTHASAERP